MDYQETIEYFEKELRYKKMVLSPLLEGKESVNEQYIKTAISAMQELQELHDQGFSLDRMKDIDFRKEIVEHINYDAYMRLMDELEEYKQLGTLEEVREAVEKQKAKEPRATNRCYVCPHCGLVTSLRAKRNYCEACGQKILWEVEEWAIKHY
ncbi:MAG: zinc ribbon domain-containing protein [Candidatus Choladocola sp.]|nr:zinc ribbon domain-containing protein [Candidatus Choladocola sp.]